MTTKLTDLQYKHHKKICTDAINARIEYYYTKIRNSQIKWCKWWYSQAIESLEKRKKLYK